MSKSITNGFNNFKTIRKKLTTPGKLISAAIYIAMIGVVYYGSKNHVYDGFHAVVPWVIAAVFFIMACVRVHDFFVSLRAERSVKSFEQTKSNLGDYE